MYLGRNYYYAHKYDSAYEQLKKILTINPNFNLAKGNLVYVLPARTNYLEAFEINKQLDKSKTFQYILLLQICVKLCIYYVRRKNRRQGRTEKK